VITGYTSQSEEFTMVKHTILFSNILSLANMNNETHSKYFAFSISFSPRSSFFLYSIFSSSSMVFI